MVGHYQFGATEEDQLKLSPPIIHTVPADTLLAGIHNERFPLDYGT